MREILGKAKTIRELLKGVKYSIDYYQREYKWQGKQIQELLDDLGGKFLEDYDSQHARTQVERYPHYFLGSIIISKKDNASYVVYGQQRLTSLTLLIMLLRNLLTSAELNEEAGELSECIFSKKFGKVSFNIDVADRLPCMDAIYADTLDEFDPSEHPESVQNLFQRYGDLEENFPEELSGEALPYFADWLMENVHLVEITAYSDDDAYTIFETMNDRGLSLSPTDMLKGYLLANIDEERRVTANSLWRDRVRLLNDAGKDVEPDFFKAWLRSQYAQKIRQRKQNARPEDFDRIGTEFHRWVRDASGTIGLGNAEAFFQFVDKDFKFYSRLYLRCIEASEALKAGLEPIFYNAKLGFTLQYMLLLAPVRPEDDEETIRLKLWTVARYIDILLAWRLWNFRRIAYSTMQYTMFNVMRDIRGLDLSALRATLYKKLKDEGENFTDNSSYHEDGVGFSVHQQNRFFVHCILARITDFIEQGSGMNSQFEDYVRMSGKNRYEVEHIWANHPDRHTDEFEHESVFRKHRNRIGGLVLLPKSFNASYGDLPYREKLPHYYGQNLLAQSLHPQTYERNPGFRRMVEATGLELTAHEVFKKSDLDARSKLYAEIAQRVWDPEDLNSPSV